MTKICIFVTICLCLTLLAGCGGTGNPIGNLTKDSEANNSGSGNSGPGSLTVLPGRSRVLLGGTQQFTASDPNATWEVNHVAGGNATFGTISSAGLYTAPSVVPINPVVVFTVRSAASNSSTNVSVDVGALSGKRFAYVSSASDDTIQIFGADGKTGTLQPMSSFSVGTGKAPTSLALSPDGKFLFSLNRGSNDISVYAIDPATGNLANAGTVPVPNGPYAMVFSSKGGDYAYVSCDGASTVAAFAFSLGTGALTPLSSGSYVAGGGRIQSLAVTTDGRFLYAANRDANQIVGLAIGEDGSLSPIAGSPFSAQPGLSSIVVSSDWLGYTYLYASSDKGVEAYQRISSGALVYATGGTQTTAGKSPELFRNVSDGYLIGVNPQSGGGFAFAFDYLTLPPGALTAGGPPVGTGTSPVAGGWLWSDNGNNNWVYVLNRQADPSSTTGSIGVYQVGDNGLVGPSATIPTDLHSPTGFVVTP